MVMGEVGPCLEQIRKEFGLNRMIIMVQDVNHARTGGVLLTKVLREKGWHMPRHPGYFQQEPLTSPRNYSGQRV